MPLQITYATMSADNAELNEAYEKAIVETRSRLGAVYPVIVNGEARTDRPLYEERSPIDSEIVVGRYSQATRQDVDDAVAAARAFAPEWEAWGWERRRDLMLKAAEVMDAQIYEIAALMSYEIGKNRLEALGDVAETVEFLRYYSRQITEHEGFITPLKPQGREHNVSVLRPWGVWVVVSPFNFPMALAAGPSIGALITGNTVIMKPSNTGALMALEFHRVMTEAGLPAGALHVLTGRGSEIGDHLTHHDGIDGITFTGSYEVGMHLYRTANESRPKPVIAEMGGKNPVVVTATADLDIAAQGVMRGAFGLSGQKCSATARVFVEKPVFDEFVDKLVAKAEEIKVGGPTVAGVFMGPVIDEGAVARFKKAVTEVIDSGGQVFAGGRVLDEGDLARGNFVEPTVVTAPYDSWIWSEELFLPFVAVGEIDDIDEGLRRSNDTIYGLTAGLFTGDESEIETWFDGIEAGVTYVNRAAGATTGAWPDIQSFGGWKSSGTSGTGGGGPWYLRQYLREQSRTVVR
ncbi:MAG: aldehyde dehydrogenase family protein [Actinobacteria bacterium]|nr:aldehyde dehydrogenase family protein [Actinomycetota bacterium]